MFFSSKNSSMRSRDTIMNFNDQDAHCHSERSEESPSPVVSCQSRRFFAALRMTMPIRLVMFIIVSLQITDIDEVTGDGGGGGHGGADEMGAPAASLAALEVAVAGGGA